MSELYCLVAGSRTFNDYDRFKSVMDEKLPAKEHITIVSGGAKGADALAERYAKEKGYQLVVIKADWDTYGKRAGYLRNEEMHKYISAHENRMCICFWDGSSKGTQHNFGLSEKYHTNLIIIRTND